MPLGRQWPHRAHPQHRLPPPGEETLSTVPTPVFHQGVRPDDLRGLPHGAEELRAELRRLLPHLLPHPGQGQVLPIVSQTVRIFYVKSLLFQAQWQYPVAKRRSPHPHRLRLHPVRLAEEFGLREVPVQADGGIRGDHGWGELGHVRVLQDPDPAGADSGQEAPRHDHHPRRNHEIGWVDYYLITYLFVFLVSR